MNRILLFLLFYGFVSTALAQKVNIEKHVAKLSKKLSVSKSSILILHSLHYDRLTKELAKNPMQQIICFAGSHSFACTDTLTKNFNKCVGIVDHNFKAIADYDSCLGYKTSIEQILFLSSDIKAVLSANKKYVVLLYSTKFPAAIKMHVKKILNKAGLNNITPFLILTDLYLQK